MSTTDPGPGRLARLHDHARRLTASTAAGGMMLAGVPVAFEYVVRPGDTVSELADSHGTTVERIVARNGLERSGNVIVAGQPLNIPAAHPRPAAGRRGSAVSQRAAGEERQVSPDERRIVSYTVRPGDTPSGLAVRFHAWTAELVEMNGPVLRVGDRIRIPVVVAAAARDRRTTHTPSPRPTAPARRHARPTAGEPSRSGVRHVIAATARRHGVDPDLALAVSWQEAGWRMHHRSSVGALGAMQVMPSTGRWMSQVVGRPLHLRDVRDNALAGVTLLEMLLDEARPRIAVAGYYQGLAGVRRHGMYADTRQYVDNVMALWHRFESGDYPA